ncbi:unnamed protein product [Trifolium pratense]|uniref:Uncharacterized protein n=1 Tax=Trifolium pratense TaxID=57577 RepID=A0ACB0JBE5_TRIPR|nr:unnamed protein product [Trifolium pratense]
MAEKCIWCIRDDGGLFRRAGTYWISSAYSILEAEALVLLEAMKDASNMNLENIIFETDSSTIVAALHANHVGVSAFSILISNIKRLLLLNSNFEQNSVFTSSKVLQARDSVLEITWVSLC